MSFLLAEEEALKAKLEGLTVSDLARNPRVVDVRFRYPEVEPTDDKYPFITIDLVDVRRSPEREHRGLTDLKYIPDEEGWSADGLGSATRVEWPIPVDLYFAVSTWARKALHSRQLSAQLLRGPLNERNTVLTIPQDQTVRRLFVVGQMPLESGRDVHGKRLFRHHFLTRVESELVPDQIQAALVNRVNIDLTII